MCFPLYRLIKCSAQQTEFSLAVLQAKGDGMGGVVPHNILFVQNLPPDASASMINMLFTQFLGFREVRLVDARPGIAFVEYESEPQATQAMSGLQNFQVDPQHVISITYAKR